MDMCEKARWYIPTKYGAKLRPWEIFIRMSNNLADNNSVIKYNYSVKRDSWNDEMWEWERDPVRQLRI